MKSIHIGDRYGDSININKRLIIIGIILSFAFLTMLYAGNTGDVLKLSGTWDTIKTILGDLYVQSILAFWLAYKAFEMFSATQPNRPLGIFFIILAFIVNDLTDIVEGIASGAMIM
jgi:hypothetical protein